MWVHACVRSVYQLGGSGGRRTKPGYGRRPRAYMEHPPPLPERELEVGRQAVSQVLHKEFTEDVLSILYYPLKQIPLPSFVAETLVWQSDTLKLFPDSAPEFKPLIETEDEGFVIGYKRVDEYTVLCLVEYGPNYALFTNEISQTAWELVGLFRTDKPSGFSDYEVFETRFKPAAETSEDSYWDRYGKEDAEQPVEPRKVEASSEEAYWNSYDSKQTHQIGETPAEQTRKEAVQALLDLVDLYKDCGFTDQQLIADDLMSVALDFPAPSDVPAVARRHAVRTWQWIKLGDSHMAELMAAVNRIKYNVD